LLSYALKAMSPYKTIFSPWSPHPSTTAS
jgi:hypothetical protein